MIRRVVIKNYRGIEALEVEPSSRGAVAKGANGSGKTSFLKALRAALAAQDIGSDAIRQGADSAEILVDIDAVHVRRSITQKGSSLAVTKDGFKAPKPQTYLAELLGTSPLDPMDLLTLKAKERRQKILEALPVTVTVEQLRKWWPKCPDNYDVSGHGLEVVETLRGKIYDKRTAVNKAAKDARTNANEAKALAEAAAKEAPEQLPDMTRLQLVHEDAKARTLNLIVRGKEAKASEERTAATTSKIATLREEAEAITFAYVTDEEISAFRKAEYQARHERQCAAERLEEARLAYNKTIDAHTIAEDNLKGANTRRELADKAVQKRTALEEQAAMLESAVQAASVQAPTKEEMDEACKAESIACDAFIQAKVARDAQEKAKAEKNTADAAEAAAIAAESEAERLGGLVKALANDAPRELLAQCDGIPGLTLEGDDVRLDGVSLDALCGAEQVRFAVQVAKRANARTKILVVDGLERLDPQAYATFVNESTADGWQLIASRVDAGQMILESIEPDCTAEAAE